MGRGFKFHSRGLTKAQKQTFEFEEEGEAISFPTYVLEYLIMKREMGQNLKLMSRPLQKAETLKLNWMISFL